MFHLLAPGSMRLIGERAIDTVVGCAIAIAASHLFPYWEYRLMGKLVKDLLAATRNYLEASWLWKAKASVRASASDATRAQETVPSAAFADGHARAAVASTHSMAVAATAVANDSEVVIAPAIRAASATAERLASVGIGESTAATASKGASAAATVAATALDRDFRYRLARKNVHVAFANLAQAFQRMMLEPKAQQSTSRS